MNLSVIEALHARVSIREYTPDLIPLEVIQSIVEAAGRAPSSKNTQPWKLFLVRGAALESLRTDYLAAFDASEKPRFDYRYSPDPLPDSWMARARQVGFSLFEYKGIARDDKEKRRAHDRENCRFFGAPQMMFLATEQASFSYGTFLDCGFVLDNLMLSLTSKGYGSCPMYSVMAYPDLLKKHIPGSEGALFIAGLACGVPLPGSHVNAFRTVREPVENWFQVVT